MNQPNPREYLSVPKAVEYTCQGKTFVYDLIEAQDFPAVADVTTGRPRYKIPTVFLLQWQQERIEELKEEMKAKWKLDKQKLNKLKQKQRELEDYYNGR